MPPGAGPPPRGLLRVDHLAESETGTEVIDEGAGLREEKILVHGIAGLMAQPHLQGDHARDQMRRLGRGGDGHEAAGVRAHDDRSVQVQTLDDAQHVAPALVRVEHRCVGAEGMAAQIHGTQW